MDAPPRSEAATLKRRFCLPQRPLGIVFEAVSDHWRIATAAQARFAVEPRGFSKLTLPKYRYQLLGAGRFFPLDPPRLAFRAVRSTTHYVSFFPLQCVR